MLAPGKIFHIYNHGNGNDNLFRQEKNYDFFLQKYEQHIVPIADTHAYCLMPNHFHLLVEIREEEQIWNIINNKTSSYRKKAEEFVSQQFSNLFNSYTKSYNKVYARRGSLFLQNYKHTPVNTDSHFLTELCYIHLNPVKHHFTDDSFYWKWTSFQFHYSDYKPGWLKSDKIKELLDTKEKYLKFHEDRRIQLIKP